MCLIITLKMVVETTILLFLVGGFLCYCTCLLTINRKQNANKLSVFSQAPWRPASNNNLLWGNPCKTQSSSSPYCGSHRIIKLKVKRMMAFSSYYESESGKNDGILIVLRKWKWKKWCPGVRPMAFDSCSLHPQGRSAGRPQGEHSLVLWQIYDTHMTNIISTL